MKLIELKQGTGIYVLEIHPKFLKPILTIGTIANVGRERLNTGSTERVVDIEVLDGNVSKRLVAPVNAEYLFMDACLYTPNSEIIREALERQVKQSQYVIESVEQHKTCKAECEQMITEMNMNTQPTAKDVSALVNSVLSDAMKPYLDKLEGLMRRYEQPPVPTVPTQTTTVTETPKKTKDEKPNS